jgi:DNA-binding NarL/FixJ family response regulator
MALTQRQSQVVDLILRGASDKQIAVELGMSFTTVRSHLRQIFARLRVESRVQLVLRIIALSRDGQAPHLD